MLYILQKKQNRIVVAAMAVILCAFIVLYAVPGRAKASMKSATRDYLVETIIPDMTTGLFNNASNILLDDEFGMSRPITEEQREQAETQAEEKMKEYADTIGTSNVGISIIGSVLTGNITSLLQGDLALYDEWKQLDGIAKSYRSATVTSGNILHALVGEGSPGALVMSALQGVALGIIVLFFFINLVSQVLRGDYTMDMWYKTLGITIIAGLVIVYLPTILSGLDSLGKGIAALVNRTLSDNATYDVAAIADDIMGQKTGFFECLILYVNCFISWLLLKITLIAIKIASYSLLIEFLVRKAFAPIAVSNMAIDGIRGPGMRYLKKYLALYIRIGIILLICAGCSSITLNMFANTEGLGFGRILECVAVNFAAIALIFRTNEIALDVVGA